MTRDALRRIAPGKTVLELGCGSALMMEEIIGWGAKKYVGIDLASVAIDRARERARGNGDLLDKVELIRCDARDIEEQNADICISLGLLDWLHRDEISAIFKKNNAKYYIHSFSERRVSFDQAVHAAYVFFLYGYRNPSYRPKYYSEASIQQCLLESGAPQATIFRSPMLSFGCFACHLPFELEPFVGAD